MTSLNGKVKNSAHTCIGEMNNWAIKIILVIWRCGPLDDVPKVSVTQVQKFYPTSIGGLYNPVINEWLSCCLDIIRIKVNLLMQVIISAICYQVTNHNNSCQIVNRIENQNFLYFFFSESWIKLGREL